MDPFDGAARWSNEILRTGADLEICWMECD